jgi:hypothetical protein
MPRFFFHVREGADLSRDLEGQEFADAKAAHAEAVNSGREMLGERLLHGGAINSRKIEIFDESGHAVAVVSANDVLFQGGKFCNYQDDVTQSAPVGKPKNSPPR